LKKKPRIDEFKRFVDLLLEDAPIGYIPWFIRLNPNSKDPIAGISWKSPQARITVEQAIDYMSHGGNVGIAGTSNDPLVNMDADNDLIQECEVKPTLMVKTRSRKGFHAYYWNKDCEKIPNIPTDEAGEVRSRWQFVVCPGSYVETDPLTVPETEREDAGYYTIYKAQPPSDITYAELPLVFKEAHEKAKAIPERKPSPFDPKKARGKTSALFEINATDVCIREGGETEHGKRWSSLFHGSDTGKNMSLSNKGLLQCWRHNRSFNGLQALAVLSGYMTCNEAGSPHDGGGGGGSRVTGDDGAIFHAWLYAKKRGYIPINDPIPVRAMHHIAWKHLRFIAEKNKPLPINIYRKVLEIVEAEY
jgi:putative DNA primase/helicase